MRPRPPRYAVRASRRLLGRVLLAIAGALIMAACGTHTAQLPPLPPAPHPAADGPAVQRIRRAGVLRVASDPSYPPMEFRQTGAPRGFDVDLAGLLASALGVRLAIVDTPFAVMRAAFPRGADMVISAVPQGLIPGLASDPYYRASQAILSDDRTTVRALRDLRGLRVAAAAGSAGAALAEGAGAASVEATYLAEQAMAAVAPGGAQAAVGDGPLLIRYAQVHPHLRAAAVGQAVPLVVVVPQDAPDLAAFVSAALRELRQRGGLEQLRRRWQL